MDKIINVFSLIVETTRRCNMSCDMCLRGAAENHTIPMETIEAISKELGVVSSITPTGGEPFLAPDETVAVLETFRENDASSAFISTNGSVSPFSPDGSRIMDAFSVYREMYEEVSEIRVSIDDYHGYIEAAPWRMLSCVSFDSGAKNNIIDRGLASEFGIGTSSKTENCLEINWVDVDELTDAVYIDIDMLYVNVHGYCFADCDLSYYMQGNPEGLAPSCYLGHISDLKETILGHAMEKHSEKFADVCVGVAS